MHTNAAETLRGLASDIEAEREQLKFVLRFAADLLDEYSDILGDNGCNDWEWPDWMPEDIRRIIMDRVQRDDPEYEGVPMDYMAVDAVSDLLRGMCSA